MMWFEMFNLTFMLVIRNMLLVMKRAKCTLYYILVFKWHPSLWSPTSLNTYVFFLEQYFKKDFPALSAQLPLVPVIHFAAVFSQNMHVLYLQGFIWFLVWKSTCLASKPLF